MRIFVTGGKGFLGRSLCKTLINDGHCLSAPNSLECNLTDSNSLINYTSEKFDQIFHLAAWTQAGDFCLYHPGEQWIINQQINTNVLNWWLKFQPQAKLIFMGTSCAYSPEVELSEEFYMYGEPIESLYTYAMTKRMLFQGARAIEKQFGLKWLGVVPSTIYGPGYHKDGRQMHFIFDLIRKIIRAKEYDEEVVLWGDGNQKREIIFINDFISSMLKVNQLVSNDLINIGSGREYSIREFAGLICDEVGYDKYKIIYDNSRYVGAKSKCLTIKKITGLIPDYSGNLSSEIHGIKQTIEWFYQEKAF